MKGFRQEASPSRKERLRQMEAEAKNTSMSVRISQMLMQQMMQNMQNMSQDLGRALGLINELQYKILAIQSVANLDSEAMNAVANQKRLDHFIEASDREDKEKNFTVGTVVKEDSTVILTSTTENPDGGIFRSRIKLADCGVPELIAAFMDREVGAKAIVKLNGVDHTIELLGIRQPPAVEVVPAEVESAPTETAPMEEAAPAAQ
jgi:hypothetical protein